MSTANKGGRRTQGLVRSGTPEQPLVSIVTVVYNGAGTIERTIQSVLEQTYANIEYMIVDGGSTDGTVDIIRRYEDRLDLWVSERDRGIYDAMNRGVALCSGEWVGMVNADDWYLKDTVQRVVAAARDLPGINIVHGDIWIQYPNGHRKIKQAKRSGFLLRYWEMVLNHPSFFVRRSYYGDHPFSIALKVGGDHHWTLRAWLEAPTMFHYLPEPLAVFSVGGASMTMPLSTALHEGDAVSRDLGLGAFHRWMGRAVKVLLYMPAKAKLWFNQFISPLASRRS